MKNVFLYPFAKDFCPKCNNRLRKIKQKHQNSFGYDAHKEAFAACKRCNFTLNIVLGHSKVITIKYSNYLFKYYETNNFLSLFKEVNVGFVNIYEEENSELTNIKDFFNYCNKITNNLLFL